MIDQNTNLGYPKEKTMGKKRFMAFFFTRNFQKWPNIAGPSRFKGLPL